MFKICNYDEENVEDDLSSYAGCIVKLVVKNKTDQKKFDKFLDLLIKSQPQELKVIETVKINEQFDADEMVDVYIKGQHKGRSIRIPVAKNFPNKHVDLLTQRLKSRGINPHAIVYGPPARKVAEDTDQ
jgi:hypothetical protein